MESLNLPIIMIVCSHILITKTSERDRSQFSQHLSYPRVSCLRFMRFLMLKSVIHTTEMGEGGSSQRDRCQIALVVSMLLYLIIFTGAVTICIFRLLEKQEGLQVLFANLKEQVVTLKVRWIFIINPS